MMRVFRGVATALTLGLVVAQTPVAHAAPQGKVIVKTYTNESTTRPGCGRHVVEIFNASNTTVLSVRVLTLIVVSDDVKKYYRGSKKKSWVTYTTYLKPGKRAWSTYEDSVLCTTLPQQNFERHFWSVPTFVVSAWSWKWEQ